MFEVAYRLFEMAALVLCVHNLSGKKVKADIHNTGFIALQLIFMQIMYIPTRQSTLHGVLVHDFRRYSARFPVISACGLFRYRYSGFC